MLPFPLLWYDPCTSGRSDVEIRYVLRFPLPIFMILSTVVPVNDLLSEPPTRKACIVVGHSAGAPATLPRCPRWSVLALAARHRNVRTERKQSVIPHVYMFADVVASVHLIMHPRAMSACISASRGIILVRRPGVQNSTYTRDIWIKATYKPQYVTRCIPRCWGTAAGTVDHDSVGYRPPPRPALNSNPLASK